MIVAEVAHQPPTAHHVFVALPEGMCIDAAAEGRLDNVLTALAGRLTQKTFRLKTVRLFQEGDLPRSRPPFFAVSQLVDAWCHGVLGESRLRERMR